MSVLDRWRRPAEPAKEPQTCEVDRLGVVDSWIVLEWGQMRQDYSEHGDISHMPVVLTNEQLEGLHRNVAHDMRVGGALAVPPSLTHVIETVLMEFEIDCWREANPHAGLH